MLNLETFKEKVIEEKQTAALCFTSSHCPPSLEQIKVINELKDKYSDKFLIEIHDIDESAELAKALRINNLPTTLFFAEGNLQEQNCLYGYQDASMLTDSFECTLWEMENKSNNTKYIWVVVGILLLIAIIMAAL